MIDPPRTSRRARSILATCAVALTFGLSLPSTSLAQGSDNPVAAPLPEVPTFTLAAEAGVGRLDEDLFLQTNVLFAMRAAVPGLLCFEERPCKARFRAVLQAPLRLRIQDRAPLEDDLLRLEDWDEYGDLLRIVRNVEYGQPGDPLRVKLGSIGPYTLGQGTVLGGYFNFINPDHYKLGASMAFDRSGVSAQALVDSVVRPTLVGAHVALRPFRWFDFEDDSFPSRLELSAQVVVDPSAPLELSTQQDDVLIDETSRPAVSRSSSTEIFGFGLGFWLLYFPAITARVGTESNFHPDVGGYGQHLTAEIISQVAEMIAIGVSYDGVFAFGGYTPRYFGPLYDVERYQIEGFGAPSAAPKSRVVASIPDEMAYYSLISYSVSVLPIRTYVSIDGGFTSSLEEADFIGLSLGVQPIDKFSVRAYYFHPNIGPESFASLDGAVLSSEARLLPLEWLYIVGRYDQRWRLGEDGRYAEIPDWYGGVGVQTAFGID